jgi:hypothetical protein
MPINSFLYPGAKFTPPYSVANSCRFEDGDSPKMTITQGNPTEPGGNASRKWTISTWVKRGNLGINSYIFLGGAYTNQGNKLYFDSNDNLVYWEHNSSSTTSWKFVTNRKFRDCSSWYSIIVAHDSTQGTEGNRVKIYINGTQETSFSTETYPSEDADSNFMYNAEVITIGAQHTQNYFDGYLAETVFIDGSQLAATSFGEFDEDSPTIWKPIDVSGLSSSKGTNGFYLDYEDSSNLGNDTWGGTDLSETNLAATDSSTDSPTNNFCTLNPLDNNLNNLPTLSEGNLEVLAVSGSTWSITPGTIALPKKGKWYFEVEAVSGTSGDRAAFAGWINPSLANPLGDGSMLSRNSNGNLMQDDSSIATGYSNWNSNGDIIGCYIDMDNSKLYFAINGTVQASGTGVSFAGGFDDDNFILPCVMVINTDKLSVNFGNPAANFAIASGNADPNGYGNFEYSTTITGDGSSKSFYAICTKNLAEFG